jgi:hypothetical protein
MSQKRLYQWMGQLAQQFPNLNKWQVTGLAIFSMGVVLSERSTLTKIAEGLPMLGKPDSLERRLQRWISNPRINITVCFRWWIRWVWSCFDEHRAILLVDETHLGSHLSIMMVGVAYKQRCIPLIWRCYTAKAYPEEGQVKLIAGLLQQVAEAAHWSHPPLVQADRGLGTSPRLIKEIETMGWRYLFRVQSHTKLVTRRGTAIALDRLVHKPGQQWRGHGVVFKKRGRIPAFVHVLWMGRQSEPWCLVSNDPLIWGQTYAIRMWQEAGFRDLKSGGWHWDRSQVWKPIHAQRLLLILAVAYAWTLTQGIFVLEGEKHYRQRVTRGRRQRFSIFRLGLRHLKQALYHGQPVCPELFFAPDKLLC